MEVRAYLPFFFFLNMCVQYTLLHHDPIWLSDLRSLIFVLLENY